MNSQDSTRYRPGPRALDRMRAMEEHGRKQSLRFGSLITLILASLILGSLAPVATAGPSHADPKPVLDQVKAQKDKEDKRKCNDFRHPCKPKKLSNRMPAIPTTAAASGDVVPRWFYLVNGLSTQSQPLVLTDASTNATNGAVLALAPVQPGSRGQVWRADALGDGLAYLSSGLGNAILLSYYGGCSAGATAAMYNSQQASPVSGADGFQQWNFTKAGSTTIGGEVVSLVTIGNPTCVGTLFAEQPYDPYGTYVLFGTGGAAPGNRWFAWPNYPLDTILKESPLPFPTGTSQDQTTAYDYISSQLYPPPPSSCTFANGYSYTGLRCAYTSAVADLTQYQSTLTNMVKFPSLYAGSAGVSVDTFSQVATQLQTEVDDVVVVNSLFNALNDANQDLGISENTGLNQYLNDALGSTTATNQVKGTTAAVLNGILYTVLSAGPGPLGVFANLMETGINATKAATQGSVQLGNPFQVAADQLWTQLNTQFLAVLGTLADMQTAIVTDWGMLHNVATLTSVSGPGSLNWQDDTTGKVTDQAAKGWAVTSMQMLLPARYQLYRLTAQADGALLTSDTNVGLVPDPVPPDYAQYAQLVGEQNTSDSLWNKYFIAESRDGNYPLEAALQNDVFDNGGSPSDLFLSTNGWNFTTNDYYLNCWGAITTITNWTERSLTVTATPQQGLQGGNGDSLWVYPSNLPAGTADAVSLPLNAYGSVSFGSAYWDQPFNSGLEIYFQVWDYGYSNTASIISFTTHQHSCNDTDKTWVDPIYYAVPGNYRYTTPTIVTQSGSNPGHISVGVYLVE